MQMKWADGYVSVRAKIVSQLAGRLAVSTFAVCVALLPFYLGGKWFGRFTALMLAFQTLSAVCALQISKNKRWEPTMEEAVRGVAALQALDSAIDQPQPQRARDLGFTADTAGNEVC